MSCQVIYALALSPSQQLQVFSKTYFQQAVKIRGSEGQGGEPGIEKCAEQTHLHLHYPNAPSTAEYHRDRPRQGQNCLSCKVPSHKRSHRPQRRNGGRNTPGFGFVCWGLVLLLEFGLFSLIMAQCHYVQGTHALFRWQTRPNSAGVSIFYPQDASNGNPHTPQQLNY